jgi:hypothetical protein
MPPALDVVLAIGLVGLLPLDVSPPRSSGIAGSVVIAFVALGLLIILAKWTSSKPRRRRKK